jgi:hypothetical protein
MNDNLARVHSIGDAIATMTDAQTKQLEKSKVLAGKAIASPEAMTSDEVQEIGWGYLVALKRLRRLGVTTI